MVMCARLCLWMLLEAPAALVGASVRAHTTTRNYERSHTSLQSNKESQNNN